MFTICALASSTTVQDDTPISIELTNIAPQNVNDADNYKIKKGEGYIRFMYALKAGVVSGTFMETESKQTFVFTNCSFRLGWNEMVMLAAQDAATDGTVTINVTTNNASTTFKWGAKSDDEVEPEPSSGIVQKINGEAIEYHSDYVFGSIGAKNYVNKSYSETEWSYVSRDPTSRYDDWRCHFAYGNNRLADFTQYYRTKDDADPSKTKYQWEGEKLTTVLDYYYLQNEGNGMSLDIEYGDIEYTKENIDINWLVVHAKCRGNRTFMTPWESAFGIRSVPYRNLISKIVLTDYINNDKYSATCTFQYDRGAQGYITKINEHLVYKLGGNTNDMVIYEFEY